jgi:hypothetical protein
MQRSSSRTNHGNKRDEETVMAKMKVNTTDQALCPVARAEAEVGDRWTVLILCERRGLLSGGACVTRGARPGAVAERESRGELHSLRR